MSEPHEFVDRFEKAAHPEGRCAECGGGKPYWKHDLTGRSSEHHPFRPDAARLSDDRGADAVREALERLLKASTSLDGQITGGLHELVEAEAQAKAALSVPAPTLPALDADPVERFWLRIATESIPRGTTVQAYRRSILRRLDEARAEKRETRDAV